MTTTTATRPRAKRGTLTLSSQTLLGVCKRLKGVVSTNSAIQAYSGVLITSTPKGVTLDASNGELSVRVPLAVKGPAMTALVSLAELETAVRAIKADAVELRVDGDHLQVAGGRRTMRLRQLRIEDFIHPAFKPSGRKILDLPAADAVRVFKSALAFVSKDQTRPILTGVAIDIPGRMVYATDSYRLGLFPVKLVARAGATVVVPAAALEQAIRHPLTSLCLVAHPDGRTATIEVGDGVIYATRLIDGQFPDYRKLIPEAWEHEATVDRDELAAAAAFVSTAIPTKGPLRIRPTKSTLHLHGHTPDGPEADEPLSAIWKGKPMRDEYGVSPDYLRQAIAALAPLRGGKLTVQTNSPLRPLMLNGREGRAMLMPIRLNV